MPNHSTQTEARLATQ